MIMGVAIVSLGILNIVTVLFQIKSIGSILLSFTPYEYIYISLPAFFSRRYIIDNNIFLLVAGYLYSIILVVLGVGIILRRYWSRILSYIYAISLLVLFPVGLKWALDEILSIGDYGFVGGIALGGVMTYIFCLLAGIFFPVSLIIFFYLPEIKNIFVKQKK